MMDPVQLVADNSQEIIIPVTGDQDIIRVIVRHVAADIQPGAALTAFLSYNGTTFDHGPHYMNTGFSYWPGEPNPDFSQQPYPLGLPQQLDFGCRCGVDAGEVYDVAMNCEIDFTAVGMLNGVEVSPTYACHGSIGFTGGVAGVSPRPPHLGGETYFPANHNAPFNWDAQFAYRGHVMQPGARIRAIKFTMGGGGQPSRLIKMGYFRAEAVNLFIPNPDPSPPPNVTFTPIGDFNSQGFTLDGVSSKPASHSAWKVGTAGWLGKTGSAPWAASQITMYGSNNDGFVLAGAPPSDPFASIVANFYESDGIPTGPTNGTLIETKTITDSNSGPSVSFNVPAGNRLSRWIAISHNKPSTSMYVAAVI